MKIDTNNFLRYGKRTTPGKNITKLADMIEDNISTEDKILQILQTMAREVPLIQESQSNNKFKRSAEQICSDRNRNGCCDSSTLFVTICRKKGIPSCQIITAKLTALQKNNFNEGHFFSACFIKEKNKWIIIESNVKNKDLINGIKEYNYDSTSQCIAEDFLVITYVNDYSDFEMHGVRINSINNMNKIHRIFYQEYKQNNKENIKGEEIQI